MIILEAIANLIHNIIFLYTWVIIISAIVSWVNPDPYNPIVEILYKLTEPLYQKIRKLMPTTISGIDLTPIIVLLILNFIDYILLAFIN